MQNMINRFAKEARKALIQAQICAAGMGCAQLRTGHILIGLARAGGPATRAVIPDIETESIERGVLSRYGNAEGGFVHVKEADAHASAALEYAVQHTAAGDGVSGEIMIWRGLIEEEDCTALSLLSELGMQREQLLEKLEAFELKQPKKDMPAQGEGKESVVASRSSDGQKTVYSQKPEPEKPSVLDQYARDLTQAARDGELEPLIGRDDEIAAMIQVLGKKTKNNPLLLGEPGVGKSALAEGLAQRIADGCVPPMLKDVKLYALDLAQLVAGSKFRGEFEERIKNVLDEIVKAGNVILFVDEMHTLIGSGGSEGSLDAANILKPALARGQIRVIGATTYKEYRKFIEKDAALTRRFQRIDVPEPDRDSTLGILNGLRERYEDFHQVKITDDALKSAVDLSARYVTERCMPDKAIDLIDEASSMGKLKAIETKENPITIDQEDIAQVISQWTGVPFTQIAAHNQGDVLHLEERLSNEIFGQDEAIAIVSRALRRAQAGLNDPKRPMGVFMLFGPSGVGKTELCKALSEAMFGSREALVRIDMSEFSEQTSVARLIGSPPGYVGHGDGGQLTDAVMKRPYSVVLFDEIEKAHSNVFSLLLQLLDDGILTDSMGRQVNFRNTIIMMTSNAGVSFEMDKKLGFAKDERGDLNEKRKKTIFENARRIFRPEFLGRIDEMIVMNSLTKADGSRIIRHMLEDIAERLRLRGVELTFDEAICRYIADTGMDDMSGARNLRRMVRTMIEDPLSDRLLAGQLTHAHLTADVHGVQILEMKDEQAVCLTE